MLGAMVTLVTFFVGKTKSAEVVGQAALGVTLFKGWKNGQKVEEQERLFNLGVNPSRDEFTKKNEMKKFLDRQKAARIVCLAEGIDVEVEELPNESQFEETLFYCYFEAKDVGGHEDYAGEYIITRTESLRLLEGTRDLARAGMNEIDWIREVSCRRLRDPQYRSLVGLDPLGKS